MYIIYLLLAPLVTSASDRCFWPNQEQTTENSYACNKTAYTNGDGTACCEAGDTCFANGVCFQGWTGRFYRHSCTDNLWTSDNCAKHASSGVFLNGKSTWLLQCNLANKTWCGLSSSEDSCCENTTTGVTWSDWTPGYTIALLSNSGTDLGRNMINFDSEATSTNSSTSTSTQTVTQTATAVTDASSESHNGLSSSAKIGLGVGLGMGITCEIALVGLVYYLFHRRRAQQQQSKQETNHQQSRQDTNTQDQASWQQTIPSHKPSTDHVSNEVLDAQWTELGGSQRSEVPGDGNLHELGSYGGVNERFKSRREE